MHRIPTQPSHVGQHVLYEANARFAYEFYRPEKQFSFLMPQEYTGAYCMFLFLRGALKLSE